MGTGKFTMSKLATAGMALMLAFALAAAPALASPQQAAGTATAAKPSAKQLKAFKKASADFSLELFGRCVEDAGKNKNVCIAPMSAMNALALTANGAKGATSRQMRAVLADGASMNRLNKNLNWYNHKLVNAKKAKLTTANGIWYDQDGITMKKAFLKSARKYYGAQVKAADFASPATVNDINTWVSKNTDGMIKKLVDRLDKDDRIAIVNALTFDAKWRVPFDKDAVQTAKFTNANGKKRKVKMMYDTEHSYIEGAGATGFMKPYAKGYSYVALLPKKGTSLKKFAKSLDGATFRKLVGGTKDAVVHIGLPKYKLDYSNENMDRQLRAMGMGIAFSRQANFKKMARSADGPLFIDTVVQKTHIEVNEDGTKAAAATGVMMKAGSAYMDDVKTVILDRPFVYAIVDNATKLPVFIGTVNDIR